MAKKGTSRVWNDITEADFIDEGNIIDQDISEFNTESMTIFGANLNYARQLVNIMDSLTPVERRILYAFFKENALPGKKTKCSALVTTAMKYHNHGDISVYATMVGMAQEWKTAVPYISGPSNFGSADASDKYGAYRYTEAYLSKYGHECFFSDFSQSAVGMVSFVTGLEEPEYLPSKFPNILVNGTSGIGWGHLGFIAPYHISDIIEMCKTYLKDPFADDIIVYPDLPTGCYIVDDPAGIEDICKHGVGKLRMRASIEIEETNTEWRLVITNVPYTVDYAKIKPKIIELAKKKLITFKHISDESESFLRADGSTFVEPKLVVKLDKALDPRRVRAVLYKLTELEKTVSINLKAIVGDTEIKAFSLKELVLAWIDQRRLYKRSLYNHSLNRLRSDIDTKDIMIELTEGKNLEKTIKIIRNTPAYSLANALMSEYGMSSHQAKIVIGQPLSAFTSDAHDRYIADREKLQKKFDEISEIAYSPKKIDKVILGELEDLRKYGPVDRRSPIIQVSDDEVITNSEHMIVSTLQGYIKKVPRDPDKYHAKNPIGTLNTGDQPTRRFFANNLDSVLFIDDYGKYTIMPVHEIPNTVYSSIGETFFNVTKLEGNLKSHFVINASEHATSKERSNGKKHDYDKLYLTTLSEDGMVKATAYSDYVYTEDGNVAKKFNVRAAKLRKDDRICDVSMIVKADDSSVTSSVLIYTSQGQFIMNNENDLPITSLKDTVGLQFIKPEDGDKCKGLIQIYPNGGDDYVVVLTAKGFAKKVELQYMQDAARKKSSYLIKVDEGDEVIFAGGCNDGETLYVITKTNGEVAYPVNSIPTLSRMAKGKKVVPVPNGDLIINACIDR